MKTSEIKHSSHVPQVVDTRCSVKPPGFFLCLSATLLLVLSLGLAGLGIWSIVYLVPYKSLINPPWEIGYYMIPGAILCGIGFLLAFLMHYNEKFNIYLTILLMLNAFAFMLVFAATYLGMNNKLLQNGKLDENTKRHYNETLTKSLNIYYKEDVDIKESWDWLQTKLNCCGISGNFDWKTVPKSCLTTRNNTGCLNAIATNLSWLINLLSGLNCVALIILFITLFTCTWIYVADKLSSPPPST